MSVLRTACRTAVVLAVTVASARAQVTKTVPGDTKLVTATINAIERGNRELTVKMPDGQHEVIYVPESIKRFDSLKVGDEIIARYYETVVLRMKAAGEKEIDSESWDIVPTTGRLSGTASRQQTITATITAIDATVPSITFNGPRGWSYSSHVEDKEALAKVKVGDRVDITWTEAMILSIDDVK